MIRMEMKDAFVRMIKNCLFKTRLENFLERSYQRLLEKGFDKIKENSWVIEERKEILESIIITRKLKGAISAFKRHCDLYTKL